MKWSPSSKNQTGRTNEQNGKESIGQEGLIQEMKTKDK
jgi:hypothetical protein